MIESAKRIAASFGLAGGIAAATLIILFLPFATVAAIRLTGWEWWAALAAVAGFFLVPILGQFLMIVLAVTGAFMLGQDNLAARKTAPTAAQAVQPAPVQPATADVFSEWRKTIAAPAIQKSCLDDVQRRGLTNTAQLDQMARACACYGAAAEAVITEAEYDDGKLSPTEGFNERLAVEAKKICQR